jgi:hypothetical protein
MSPESVVRLLAEPTRLRVFAAITLGATTPDRIAELSGVTARDAAVAIRRLQHGGLVETGGPDLIARVEVFKELAREAAPPAEEVDEGEAILRRYVRDDRLVDFPAQWSRKLAVLGHLARHTFVPGERYDEQTVNERLARWCEGAPIDHVSIRRYLIDVGYLTREGGEYWMTGPALA